jgi:aminopeptidase
VAAAIPVDAPSSLARVAVDYAANVQPGQVVIVEADVATAGLAREVATAAYARGAKFVDVVYSDTFLKRVRAVAAGVTTLDFVPPWYADRLFTLASLGGAWIRMNPPVIPGVLDGLDPELVARDELPMIKERRELINSGALNWAFVPAPSRAWAAIVHSTQEPDDALALLWRQVARVCRLDTPDPARAWQERLDRLEDVARRLNALRLDALHLEGGGTDLSIGLLPTSVWTTIRTTSATGIEHVPNLPSEEVFTAPDPRRVEGVASATKPIVIAGTIVRGLRVRFEAGLATAIDADIGASAVQALCAKDDGASRLGEIALVDAESRVAAEETIFYSTLLDENVASHVAFGDSYARTVAGGSDRFRNRSKVHADVMIGGPELVVSGVTSRGHAVPIMRSGAWLL